MTDNEKAATFMGWKPGPCDANDNCPRWEWSDGVSAPLGRIHIDHAAPAPDMSDPRNYMKALEDLRDVLPGFYLSDGDGWIADFRVQNPSPKSEWGTDEWIKFSGNDRKYANFAECAVATLAALYDAEHA